MAHNTLTYTYADLDLDFTKHAVSKDVGKRYDEEAIKRSVKNLVYTMHYERPFHPEVGCMVHSLLFENATPMTGAMVQRTIEETLNNLEPRIRLLNVIVVPKEDENAYEITIVFNIVSQNDPIELTLMLKEVR